VLHELVRAAADQAPDHPAIEGRGGPRTYGQLAGHAGGVGAALAARGIGRVACLVAEPASLIGVLAGASAAGVDAAALAPSLDDRGVQELCEAFDLRHVVTDRPLALDGITVLPAGDLGADLAELAPRPGPAPVTILTTGTTGRPKAARHDWSRLVAGVHARALGPDDRLLLAYNLHQFAGVQVLLHAFAAGATLVLPASQQPRDGVAAMAEHGVTHASATPTFWRFAVAQIDPALAARIPLRQITLGGEAVPAKVLEDLSRLFPSARVSQVYASTEFGTGVSVRDAANGLPLSVLDRGDDAPVQLKVVDGELHVRSRVGMLGYVGSDDVGDAEWRPTGDLVEVRGDRLHFVGRTSEVINVGGVKVHPLPIEEVIGAVPSVRLAHVYGRANAMTGQIVVAEVVADDGADLDALEVAIRASCAALPAAAQPRRIKFVEEPQLREGKVARGAS
jgi:acyl-CoA synthetase (AMP-forming)/AMP-acid ligase II